MGYCSISVLVTKGIDSFADTSLVDVCSCVVVIDAVTPGSLQALLYSLQAVPCSLFYVCTCVALIDADTHRSLTVGIVAFCNNQDHLLYFQCLIF